MSNLPQFSFPLTALPSGYSSSSSPSTSSSSPSDFDSRQTTKTFKAAVRERDTFLGKARCIICGLDERSSLGCVYIIQDTLDEIKTWIDLKNRNWLPPSASEFPRHDPKNGLLMCPFHGKMFELYKFFIRYVPETQKFILINYTSHPSLARFHGRAIALSSPSSSYPSPPTNPSPTSPTSPTPSSSPYPALFIIHEMRVRGFNPFQLVDVELGERGERECRWVDWVEKDGVVDEETGELKRGLPPVSTERREEGEGLPEMPPFASSLGGNMWDQGRTEGGGEGISGRPLPSLNEETISAILKATRESNSWRACVAEASG